jgi:hypothetical protein
MFIENKYRDLKINKFYIVNKQFAVFTNNIYRVSYKGLNDVYFNNTKLDSYHNEFFENFWINYSNKLMFASGVLDIINHKLIIYSMDVYHKYLNKGSFDKKIFDRIIFYFNFEIDTVKEFKFINKIKEDEFLFSNLPFLLKAIQPKKPIKKKIKKKKHNKKVSK